MSLSSHIELINWKPNTFEKAKFDTCALYCIYYPLNDLIMYLINFCIDNAYFYIFKDINLNEF